MLFGFWKILNRHQDFVSQQLLAAEKRAEDERRRYEAEQGFRRVELGTLVKSIDDSSRAERESHQRETEALFTRLDRRDEALRSIQEEIRRLNERKHD